MIVLVTFWNGLTDNSLVDRLDFGFGNHLPRWIIKRDSCLNQDEAEKVEKADFVPTTLKQVLRSIKARYYLPGCSHRLVNVLVSVVIGRPFYELPTWHWNISKVQRLKVFQVFCTTCAYLIIFFFFFFRSNTLKSVRMELLSASENRDAGSINFCLTPVAATRTFA